MARSRGEARQVTRAGCAPNIFAIGINYRKHADESGNLLPDAPAFSSRRRFRPAPGRPDRAEGGTQGTKVEYEREFAVVIGTRCKNATRANALDYVLGYTCGNDVSARD